MVNILWVEIWGMKCNLSGHSLGLTPQSCQIRTIRISRFRLITSHVVTSTSKSQSRLGNSEFTKALIHPPWQLILQKCQKMKQIQMSQITKEHISQIPLFSVINPKLMFESYQLCNHATTLNLSCLHHPSHVVWTWHQPLRWWTLPAKHQHIGIAFVSMLAFWLWAQR